MPPISIEIIANKQGSTERERRWREYAQLSSSIMNRRVARGQGVQLPHDCLYTQVPHGLVK